MNRPLLLLLVGASWALAARAAEPLETRALGPQAAQLAAREQLERKLAARLSVTWDPASGAPSRVGFDPPVPLEGHTPETAARHAVRLIEPLWGRLPLDEQRERRGPHVALGAVRRAGPLRRVELAQLLRGAEVDGARLVVTLGRRGGRCVLVEVAGRAFRDVPWSTPLLPPERVPAGARQVVAWTDQGWRALVRSQEQDAHGLPVHVFRDPAGAVVLRRSLARSGMALAQLDGREHPLADLHVAVDGQLVVTDPAGRFPGQRATLPQGLSGPALRVLPSTTQPWPGTSDGWLRVGAGADPARREELTVWLGLAAARRFYAGIAGVEQEEADRPILARVGDGMLNAFAVSHPTEVDGRRYEALLAFGRGMGLDRTVISHERGHAFVRHLGYDGYTSTEEGALNEALADYLAAAELGTSWIGAEGLGDHRRDIEEDRVYPRHVVSGNKHQTGVIFGGALWDARRAAGREAGAFDAAVVRMVRRLGPGANLPGAARLLAQELAPGPLRDLVEAQLRRHGLLSDGSAPLELRVVSPARVERGDPLVLAAGDVTELVLLGVDPQDEHAPPGQSGPPQTSVDVMVSGGPEWVRLSAPRAVDRGWGPPGRELRLRLEPPPGLSAVLELSVLAQSRRSDQTAFRTIRVRVDGEAAPSNTDLLPPLTFEVQAGTCRVEPLAPLFPGMPADARYRVCGSNSYPGGYGLDAGVTRVSDAVAVAEGALHMAPEADEEGPHLFWIMAEPEGARSFERVRWRQVRMVVRGAHPGAIQAFGGLSARGGMALRADLVPPGAELSVTRGAELRLNLMAWADEAGRLELAPGAPAALRADRHLPGESELLRALAGLDGGRIRTRAGLVVRPAREGPLERLEVTVLLRPVRQATPEGEAPPAPLARRTFRVLVLPAAPVPAAETPPADPVDVDAPPRPSVGFVQGLGGAR